MNGPSRAISLARLFASLAIMLIVAAQATTKPSHTSRTHTSALAVETNGVTLNLHDFGSVGDGVANDAPAFQSALDALASAGGGTLFVPAGRYLVATPVAKDFSTLTNGTITIQGVPSNKMPAPPTASGNELSQGLNLTSEIISAAGPSQITFLLSNLKNLRLEHLVFLGRPDQMTDALTTLHLDMIEKATISHCEFYGLSTFGLKPEYGGGNIVRAVQSNLSIELSVFLGCTGNSGAYAAVVANLLWRKFSITNSIFLDYGQRPGFFSKTGYGAPLSWIDIGNAAPPTPSSPRREFVVRETFLDEGGWVGISAFPHRWGLTAAIDLVYISGLKVNVPNMGTTGHMLYDLENLLIEKSQYGWSTNAYAAVDMHRIGNAILDNLTCIDHATQLSVDSGTSRFTVINSVYGNLNSQAQISTVLNTAPENDPVQYVRQQFLSTLGRQPDPTAHFYWSDLLLRCGEAQDCLNQQRAALTNYLATQPQPNFSFDGTVQDENANPVSGVLITLSGSQSVTTVTDAQGHFQFLDLPTSGTYTLAANKQFYSFGPNQTFTLPSGDVTTTFAGQRERHEIGGRITNAKGAGVSNVTVQLSQSTVSTTTDADGYYSISELLAGEDYTVVPSSPDYVFTPSGEVFENLSANQTANFVAQQTKFLLGGRVSDEDGTGISGVTVTLTGTSTGSTVTDVQGNFRFRDLPTGASYTISVNREHYSFSPSSQTLSNPLEDVIVEFSGSLNRHSISGRIMRVNGSGIGGLTVQLGPATSVVTDANGYYSFTALAAGQNYVVVPSSTAFAFSPANKTFDDLSGDVTADFVGKIRPRIITADASDQAIALDSLSLMAEPFSILSSLAFSSDGLTRLVIFASDVEDTEFSQLSLVALDDAGATYPLIIEQINPVRDQSWMKQVNFKLSQALPGGKCVWLRLAVGEVTSNDARICLSPH